MGNLLSSDAVEAKPNDQQIVCKPPPPKAELYSHEVPGTRTANRGAAHVGGGEDVFDPQSTLYTNLLNRKKVDPDGTRPLFGWRKIDPETKEAGPYEWINMNEFLPQVEACASGMHLDLGTERGALIGLFSKNRYEWCLVEHACSRMAYTIVPLYDTLGPTAVPFIMNHTEMKVVFCAKAQFKTLMGCIHECPTVKTVVQFEDDVDNEERELADKSSVRLLTLADVVAHGKTNIVPADPPTPDDIATICYTSGTTGDPKGVMLSHANMMAEEAAGEYSTCTYPGDIHISYLPLAHVYERSLHATVIKNGGGIGFYQGDVSKIVDDLQALRPTLFVTVPRLLNRVHDKITQGLASAPTAKRFVFERAYNSKKRHLADGHLSHAVWDRVVFDKLKALLGGRVRLIVIGSAPVSKEVKQFFQIVFGCPVLEGYGLTETCAGICCSLEPMDAGNHVGVPLPGVQMCLEDVPEMNYTSNDTPLPRGEILIKGPVVFAGYYKQPELTQQSKDNDGWFHTGDVGCWNANGTLSVIDRKKNIFKLSQGEYVAPEKIEAIYAKSPLVAQAYVHGNSLQNFLVGVVMPDPEIIKEWAAQRGKDASLEKLCEDEDLRAAVAEDLEELGKRMKLFRFERIQKLVLTAEGFTQENDLMTPTFKLKRAQIAKRFAGEIDAMYGIDPKNPRKF